MDKNLAVLYEPFQIRKMKLKNRIVMAPMHTKMASESGEVTDRMIAYLVERARGDVGLIVLENTCIDWLYGRAYGNPVSIHDDLCRSGLSNVALAVHRYGAKIVTQLHHTGRQNTRANIDGRLAPVAPSAVKSHIGGDMPRPLEEHEIEGIIQQYADAARRTKDAGFDGVELHGAHGYILTQFFSPYTNRREDKWGGSLKNRARFPVEVVRRIRAEVGPDFPILYRLSAEERVPGGTTLEDSLKLVQMLEEAGVDCFDVTAGIYDSIEWIYTLQGVAPGALIPLAAAVKGVTTKPVIGVSRLGWDLGFAAQVVKENKVDLVAIGRSLLADPHLAKKFHEGRTKEIRRCIACNECVAMENKGWQIHCIINPMLGNEYLDPVKPARTSKKVVVIGGGPAGMECALVAAQRGHEVALIEKSSRLGGQLLAASTPAYKRQEFEALIEYYGFMLSKLRVKVILNTEIKNKLPDDQRADVVVLALGAVPHSGKFEKNGKVVSAFDVLMSRGKGVGKNVAVIGASGVGIDVALFLMEKEGRKVTVVEMLDEVGGDVNEFLKRHTLGMAEQKGITFLTNSEVVDVESGKVYIKTLLGNKTLKCDTVVSATGFSSREAHPLKEALAKKGAQVFVIGSAVEPGKIFDATQAGFWTAIEI
jgi:2,4-dienoyl-CoA reductase-like NADH-dependent reductase (Old Yellow Enzyme family)/thioredoxin reductase